MADGSGSNEPSVARGVTGESARPGSAGGKSAPVVIGDGETTPPVNASTYSGGYSNGNCNTSVSALNGNRGTPSSAPPRTAPHITPQTSPNPPLHVDTLPTSPIVPSSTSSSTVPTINTDWIQQYGFTEIGFDDFVNVVGEIKNVPGVGSMERYRYLIGEVKVLLEDVERADPAVPKQHFSAVAAAMTVGRSLDVGQAIQRYWNAMVHAREQHGQGQQAPAQTQQGQVQQVQGQQVQGQQSQAREVQAQQAQAQRVQAQQGQAGREQAQQVQEYQPRGNASPADIAAQATRKVYTPQPQHSASTTHGPQHFTRPSPSTAAQRMPGPQYVQVPSQGMQSGSHAGSVPSRQQGASSTSPTKQTIPLQGQPTRLNGQIMQCSQPSRQIRQGPPPPPPVIRGPLDPTGGQAYYAQPVNAPIAQGPQSGHAGPSRRMTDPQQHTAAGAQLPLRKSGYGAVQASPPVPATSALLAPTAPSPPNNASAMGVAALAGIEDAYKQMQDNLSKQMEATWNTFLEPSNAVLKQLTDLVKLQATQLDVLNAQIDERVLDQATGITAHIAADGEIARLKEVNSALVAGHARDLQKEKALNAQSTSRHAATLDKLKADIKAEQDKSANLARERDNTKAQLRNAELAAQRAEREVQLARDNAAWDPNRPELHRKMSAVGEGASGAEDEIASLRKKLDARTAKMTALERERKAEVDGLQAKLEKADKIAADLKVDLLREKQSVAVKVDNQVKDRLIDLKMKMREELDEEVQGTIKRLGDDNDDLAEQLDMEKAAVHSLTLTVARLERAVPLDGDVAAVAEELATTKTALAEAKAENTDIYAQVTEAMDRTKSEKDRADRNADQVARLEQQLSSAGMRLKDLETSVDSADNRIRSAETNARTASAHLDDTKKQLESLNTEVARLKAVEATVQTLRSERDASLENVRQIQSAHTDAINRLRELIQVLVEVRQYLGVEDPTTPTMSPEIVAAVSQDVRTALKQLQDSRAQRIAQEAAAATLQTALDTEIAISSSLRSQLAQERMQHGEAEAALSTLKGTIDKLEKAREDSRTAADKARTHLAELAAQGAELKELREKYTRTKQELDTALKALDDKEGEEVADLVGMVSPESDNTPTMSAGPKAPVPAVKVSVNRPMLCERGDSTQTMAVPPQGPAIAGAVLTAATGNPGQLGSDTFTSPLNDVKGIASQAPPERGQQKAPASVSPATEVNKIAPVPSGPNVNTSNSTTSNATPAKTPFRSTSAASYSTTPSSRPNGNKQTSGPVSTSAVGVPAAPVTGTTSTNAALVAGSGVATTKPASKSRWVTNTPTESAVPNGSAGTPAPRTKSAPSPVKTATAPRPSIGTIKTPASTQRRTDLTPSKVDRPTPAAIHTEVKGPSSIHAGKAAGFRSSTSPTPPLSSRQASPKVPEAVSSPAVSPKLTKTPASAVTAAASTAPPASPAAPAATSLEKRKDETASSSNAQGKRDSATPALALAPALSQKRAREEPLFSPGQEEQEEAEVGSASQKREAKKARQLIKSPAAGSSQLKQISVDSDTEDEAPQRPTQPMTSAARLAQNNGIMRSLTPSTPTPASSGFKAALGGSQSVPRLSTSSRSTDTTGSASQRSALSSSSGANTPKTSTKAGVSATGGSTSTPSTSTFTPASSSKAPSASQPVRQRQSLPASSSSSAARSASQRPATPSLNGLDRSASVASTLRAETPLSSQAMRTAVSPMPPNGITREWIMGNLKCCQKRHVSGKGMVCKCCFLQLDKAERSSKYNNEPANYTPMAVMSETERIDHYMTHAEKLWGVRERRIREGKEADFR